MSKSFNCQSYEIGNSRLKEPPRPFEDLGGHLQQVLQLQQDSLLTMAKTLGSSISKGFEMPKWEYLMFDGNSMNYPRFIENFKTNIEERESDPKARLGMKDLPKSQRNTA